MNFTSPFPPNQKGCNFTKPFCPSATRVIALFMISSLLRYVRLSPKTEPILLCTNPCLARRTHTPASSFKYKSIYILPGSLPAPDQKSSFCWREESKIFNRAVCKNTCEKVTLTCSCRSLMYWTARSNISAVFVCCISIKAYKYIMRQRMSIEKKWEVEDLFSPCPCLEQGLAASSFFH